MGDEAFQLLIAAMRRSPKPLAFIGSGASVPSGYPDWPQLLSLLERRANAVARSKPTDPGAGMPPRLARILRDLGDPAWQADEYRRAIGNAEFDALMQELFSPKSVTEEPYHAIARLGFRHFLTTNYDSCIEKALEAIGQKFSVVEWGRPDAMHPALSNLSDANGPTTVLYLHGRFDGPERIVLTETSYVQRYIASQDARIKLLALFMTSPVVFVGFSMNDPDLGHFMREVTARIGPSLSFHFAIMGYRTTQEREAIRRRMSGKYGVKTVFYRIARDGSHDELARLLDRIGDLSRADGAAAPVAVAVPEISDGTTGRTGSVGPRSDGKLLEDELDPHKGKWGRIQKRNGRRARVEKIWQEVPNDWLDFSIVVEPLKGKPPITGGVRFHLHPTFPENMLRRRAANGKVRLRCWAFGAFTMGISIDDEPTRLELDLALQPELPLWFRQS